MAMVIWEGPSLLTGEPLVVLATFSSGNSKTGPMTQTHILRADMSPLDAITAGADQATCGDCVHGATRGRSCYVHSIIRRRWGSQRTWESWAAGSAKPFNIQRFVGSALRIGTYGDPAAVPASLWFRLVAAAGPAGHTGYTHQWRTCDRSLRHLLMASCDTDDDVRAATAAGWNTFQVHPVGTPRPAGSKPCPASEEMNRRLTCEQCLRCGGTSTGRRGNHVAIMAHGNGARRFAPLPLSVVSAS